MSNYWKNMGKSLGYAALTGFYGLVTVILAKKALACREQAFAYPTRPSYTIQISRTQSGEETKPEAGK